MRLYIIALLSFKLFSGDLSTKVSRYIKLFGLRESITFFCCAEDAVSLIEQGQKLLFTEKLDIIPEAKKEIISFMQDSLDTSSLNSVKSQINELKVTLIESFIKYSQDMDDSWDDWYTNILHDVKQFTLDLKDGGYISEEDHKRYQDFVDNKFAHYYNYIMPNILSPYRKGFFAEYYCMLIMLLKGYRIIGHRVKTPLGEIDVLAKRGDVTCIIEVKYRSAGLGECKLSLRKSYERVYKASSWMRITNNVEFKYFVASGLAYEMGDLVY